ncbi:MAG: cache domain-containing protein [Candidatus Cloacimonetes bacterium]|nr:cache domain-containing protein [Candidatus Cloacimonadota bacterium]MCF7813980.1 cache domain-containing protein [Candidatus Cloacimonadota bacterium]MCF7868824.1 cache domain-containing protein [Candidatus Cloacimonadota bacterium]MCF7884083.1 cache domain-containing protein [Candidatus Cloacimonadota bacterium]
MKKFLIFVVLAVILLSACTKKVTPKDWEYLASSMQKVDEIVQNELNRLQNIAASDVVKSGEWEEIKPALILDAENRTEALYWYCLPDGSYYTSEKDKVDANLSSRGYFPDLLAGNAVVGYPIIGKTSGRKSFVIAVPIFDNQEVTGILGTSIFLGEMWDILKNKISIPEEYDFYAVNTNGFTMFDLETKDHLLDDVLNQSSPTLVEAIKVIIASENGSVSYKWNDKNKIAIYKKSPVSDWRYVLSFY